METDRELDYNEYLEYVKKHKNPQTAVFKYFATVHCKKLNSILLARKLSTDLREKTIQKKVKQNITTTKEILCNNRKDGHGGLIETISPPKFMA